MSEEWITDLDHIRRLAEREEREDVGFRMFLKGDIGCSDEELDAMLWQALADVAPAIDCLACANCCRVMRPGVTGQEIERLAPRLGLSVGEFRRLHIVVEWGEEYIETSPCPFLEGNRCAVYEDRPEVCREYPHLHKPDFSFRTMGILDSVAVCPIVFNVWRLLKDRTGFRERGGA
jgi:hypothetical protein